MWWPCSHYTSYICYYYDDDYYYYYYYYNDAYLLFFRALCCFFDSNQWISTPHAAFQPKPLCVNHNRYIFVTILMFQPNTRSKSRFQPHIGSKCHFQPDIGLKCKFQPNIVWKCRDWRGFKLNRWVWDVITFGGAQLRQYFDRFIWDFDCSASIHKTTTLTCL